MIPWANFFEKRSSMYAENNCQFFFMEFSFPFSSRFIWPALWNRQLGRNCFTLRVQVWQTGNRSGVNFINILQSLFLPIFWRQKISNAKHSFVIFAPKYWSILLFCRPSFYRDRTKKLDHFITEEYVFFAKRFWLFQLNFVK